MKQGSGHRQLGICIILFLTIPICYDKDISQLAGNRHSHFGAVRRLQADGFAAAIKFRGSSI